MPSVAGAELPSSEVVGALGLALTCCSLCRTCSVWCNEDAPERKERDTDMLAHGLRELYRSRHTRLHFRPFIRSQWAAKPAFLSSPLTEAMHRLSFC